MGRKRLLPIITLIAIGAFTAPASNADKNVALDGIESLLRMKQQFILEQMAGDGETPFQRELQKQLDQRQTTSDSTSQQQTMNRQLCTFWKQQTESQRRSRKLHEYCE